MHPIRDVGQHGEMGVGIPLDVDILARTSVTALSKVHPIVLIKARDVQCAARGKLRIGSQLGKGKSPRMLPNDSRRRNGNRSVHRHTFTSTFQLLRPPIRSALLPHFIERDRYHASPS